MKRYLLDTAPLGALLLRRTAARALITPWLLNDEVATSLITYGEVIEYIRGWANYHSHVVSSEVFGAMDNAIFKALWHWSKRRHQFVASNFPIQLVR